MQFNSNDINKGMIILCIKIFYLNIFAASYHSNLFDVEIDVLLKNNMIANIDNGE